MPSLRTHLVAATLLAALVRTVFAADATITVDLVKPGHAVSPTLYGIFFEDINRAADGGIYAEMVQNRSFEDGSNIPGWTVLTTGEAKATMALDTSAALNANNPTALKLTAAAIGGGRAGAVNRGYDQGMCVRRGAAYVLSVYVRGENGAGPLLVSLEKGDGTVLASQSLDGITTNWARRELTLTASDDATTAQLVLTLSQPGTVYLDMVSLFPKEAWKGRPNGLRPDLMETIARMHPAFVRFPGGCFVEGNTLPEAFRWKKTIGDIAQRPGHWNLWGYRSTDGLGYHEYLQMCEDLGAEPLFVINCGMSHTEQNRDWNKPVPELPDLQEYVQDAVDAIEYANGPADSTWGALRAKAGHPAPFNLHYMEIGNENGGPIYNQRYALFVDAIRAKYPEMHLIANNWFAPLTSRPVEIFDDHMYTSPEQLISKENQYDGYDRQGPKRYVGEYAVTSDCGRGNLRAALAEAVYMNGLERNSDVVIMASYAPLLENTPYKGWNPNAIVFSSSSIYGTPSYWVQCLYGANRPDVLLPVRSQVPSKPIVAHGRVGVGTWDTQAEFKDFRVTRGDQTLLTPEAAAEAKAWEFANGDWKLENGILRQTSDARGAQARTGDVNWGDCTISLRARKTGGGEGFMVFFDDVGGGPAGDWNIGGWGNTRSALKANGLEQIFVPGNVETGRWYDIRIELQGDAIRCYLDGKLVHDARRTAAPQLWAIAGRSGDNVIVKTINVGNEPVTATITLDGALAVAYGGTATILTSTTETDENSFDHPTRVAPMQEPLKEVGQRFDYTFRPNSLTILRVKAMGPRPVN